MNLINTSYKNGNANKLAENDRAVHDWYRFVLSDEGVKSAAEKHYRLVHPDELSSDEIKDYQSRISQ